MDSVDAALLMEAQYNFPLVERPFLELGRRVGIGEDEAIERLRRLATAGILKRIGAVMNYRAKGLEAALVGFAVPPELVDKVAEEINRDPQVSHNFLRDYAPFNVWFVTKAPTPEELEAKVKAVADRWGLDYVVLYSLRTYKLDVRFDIVRGISRSKPQILPENPPRIEQLGVPRQFYSKIRSLPLTKEPFREAAEALGKSVGEALDLIQELQRVGVLRELHATLDGEALGFRENAMVVLREPLCEEAAMMEESTHVVLRNTVPGKWPYPCYFMIHATTQDKIAERLRALRAEHRALFSLRDLLGSKAMGARIEAVSD
nr:MAG: heme biosynthesis protein [Thermoproteus sp. AZ2]